MVASEKHTPTTVFALSPPLSTTAGASDCELDNETNRRHEPARPDSSPLSLTSSRAQSLSKAASPYRKQGKKEEESDHSQQTRSRRGRSRQRRGADLDRAFSLIKASWREELPEDLPSADWCVLRISPTQYLELCRQLEGEDPDLLDYFKNLLRFDYNPDRGLLILRLMANAVHEYLQERLMDKIKTQLWNLAAQSTDAVFSSILQDIQSLGHTRIELGAARRHKVQARKCPDGQFRFQGIHTPPSLLPPHYKGSSTPECLIEVGNSQKADALEDLAQEYYEKSMEDGIKAVLTIDTQYTRPAERLKATSATDKSSGPSREAAYCLYRGPDRVCHNVVFRSADGQPVDGGPLRFFVTDFVPDHVLQQLSPQLRSRAEETTIDLRHDFLYRSLVAADRAQELEDEKTRTPEPAVAQASRPAKRVRWRETQGLDDDDDDAPSRSKRPRTRSLSRGASNNLPERRRTRSTARGEGT